MGVTFVKDPNEVLDYGFDWGAWMTPGDSIATSTWTVSADKVTIVSSSNTTTSTTVWLSGGDVNQSYSLTNLIVTTGVDGGEQRTAERSALLRVQQR